MISQTSKQTKYNYQRDRLRRRLLTISPYRWRERGKSVVEYDGYDTVSLGVPMGRGGGDGGGGGGGMSGSSEGRRLKDIEN